MRDFKYQQQYLRQYLEKNRESRNQQSRQWVANNRGKRLAVQQRYRDTHKDKITVITNQRRAKQQVGTFTAEDWQEMKDYYNYTCLCCGRKEPAIKLTLDHIHPLAKNGIHSKENIQPLCRPCNSRKGTKTIDYRPKGQGTLTLPPMGPRHQPID